MVEPLIPSFKIFFFQLHNFFAKATPKSALSIPSDSLSFWLLFDVVFVYNLMTIFKVGLKQLSAIEYFGTLFDQIRTRFMASPCFNLIMLSVLVSFPIILTSKFLWARRKSASIWPSMAFLVFSIPWSAFHHKDRRKAYLRSHCLTMVLGQYSHVTRFLFWSDAPTNDASPALRLRVPTESKSPINPFSINNLIPSIDPVPKRFTISDASICDSFSVSRLKATGLFSKIFWCFW